MSCAELSLNESFDLLLGSEQSERFVDTINRGFKAGLTGKKLQEHISNTWKEFKKYRRAAGYPDDEVTRIFPC